MAKLRPPYCIIQVPEKSTTTWGSILVIGSPRGKTMYLTTDCKKHGNHSDLDKQWRKQHIHYQSQQAVALWLLWFGETLNGISFQPNSFEPKYHFTRSYPHIDHYNHLQWSLSDSAQKQSSATSSIEWEWSSIELHQMAYNPRRKFITTLRQIPGSTAYSLAHISSHWKTHRRLRSQSDRSTSVTDLLGSPDLGLLRLLWQIVDRLK